MARDARSRFRFDPPPLAATPELVWVLVRAFAPVSLELPAAPRREPARLAAALGLAARIAARHRQERLALEVGATEAEALARSRAATAARELRLERALEEVARRAAELGAPIALLKGRALARAGYAPEAGRPAADVDLLVPEARLRELQLALEGSSFQAPSGAGYEHQAPLLRHEGGGAVELHRALPGVRVDGRRSATFEALEARGLLEALPEGASDSDRLLVPVRAVAIAHALVHTLAQHAFVASHPGFLLVADLIDLGAASAAPPSEALEWIARDVSEAEASAALELARAAAGGEASLLAGGESLAGQLCAHFVACALDPDYGESLKLRSLAAPVSDRPPGWARLTTIARAFVPPPGSGVAGWLRRPLDLAARWRAARRGAAKTKARTQRR